MVLVARLPVSGVWEAVVPTGGPVTAQEGTKYSIIKECAHTNILTVGMLRGACPHKTQRVVLCLLALLK